MISLKKMWVQYIWGRSEPLIQIVVAIVTSSCCYIHASDRIVGNRLHIWWIHYNNRFRECTPFDQHDRKGFKWRKSGRSHVAFTCLCVTIHSTTVIVPFNFIERNPLKLWQKQFGKWQSINQSNSNTNEMNWCLGIDLCISIQLLCVWVIGLCPLKRKSTRHSDSMICHSSAQNHSSLFSNASNYIHDSFKLN